MKSKYCAGKLSVLRQLKCRLFKEPEMAAKPPMKMALWFEKCGDDSSRPRYGLVDDEELFRHGRSVFLCTDGRRLIAAKNDVILLRLHASDIGQQAA